MTGVPATFGAGCYWGTEHFFVRNFKDALLTHEVGFMGGVDKPGITYEEVKKGDTGHAEVLHLTYDPEKVSYNDLLEYLFRIHNSTTLNQQGRSTGTNYRSTIFYHNEEQKKSAEDYIARLSGKDKELHEAFVKAFDGKPCVTTIEKAGVFYPAHKEHQNYLEVNPDGYCSHRVYF
ncbi:peptide-methionine (S)-S-oxide reductase [Angomonas deanei]|uniref:peptide-methionine (S)-S-oxide reductase n=1 Tax=Angomonas deanei TaxID=59799 RepID=A0A7G2CRR2_9TRYP|nr:peptide-methionine (S)-S-oxide reductase [Angomonas deanei]CAD2222205.1 Peptide methionine sulfoxide reductase, putative [Angomonas deanei]|eukprot:EPY42436.1 peptide-methionine (S)-S-oxide reductase [Angomonas deanei]